MDESDFYIQTQYMSDREFSKHLDNLLAVHEDSL